MKQLNILLLLIATIISSTALAGNTEGNIPDFKDLAGEGTVKVYFSGTLDATEPGKLLFVEDYPVTGRINCQGLQLLSSSRFVVAIAHCGDNDYIMCSGGGGTEECDPSQRETKVTKNTLQRYYGSYFSVDGNSLVDLYPSKFIFRSQDRNCLIEGPHAMCFFEGFSWKDNYVVEFQKK